MTLQKQGQEHIARMHITNDHTYLEERMHPVDYHQRANSSAENVYFQIPQMHMKVLHNS